MFPFTPTLVFLRFYVFELGARTGRKSERTEKQTDGRTRPVMRPIGTIAQQQGL